MADVETAVADSTPGEKVISKTVEVKTEEDGAVVTEETTVIEINGDPKELKDEQISDSPDKPEEKENGSAVKEIYTEEKSNEQDAAAIETNTAEPAAVEQPKEQSPPKVILHQFPPSKDVPSPSLFCLKVETFLRLHKIPYENHYGAKPGKKGKLPWIEYQGDKIADSGFIFDYLNSKFELNIDNEFTDEQKALGSVISCAVQEKLYFALMYNRWIVNYQELKKIQKQQQSGLTFAISLKMQQNKMVKHLDGQGMGRHSKDEVYQMAHNDIKAISTLLGDKEFILGDKPSSYDCAVFALFAQCIWNGIDESLAANFIKENASNIIAYCERIKALCWHDWSDMILGDKPAPPKLTKKFSYRFAKRKPKTKEEPAEKKDEQQEEKKEEQSEENKDEVAEKVETEEQQSDEPKTNESMPEESQPEDKTTEETNKTETGTKIEEAQKTEEQAKTAEEAKTNEE